MKTPRKVTVKAPAKVNLYLQVLGKRPDGYHDLLSVMQALDLADELTFERSGAGIEITCDSAEVPPGPGNIVYRAAEMMLALPGARGGAKIDIRKMIPVAAGLGGGSSDAAATL